MSFLSTPVAGAGADVTIDLVTRGDQSSKGLCINLSGTMGTLDWTISTSASGTAGTFVPESSVNISVINDVWLLSKDAPDELHIKIELKNRDAATDVKLEYRGGVAQ